MATASPSVVIDRPVSEVFAFLSDLDRAPEWAPQMGKIDARGRMRPDLSFTEQRRFLGRPGVARWRIHKFVQDREIGLTMSYGPMSGEFVYHFDPIGPASTRVSQDIAVRLGGPLAVLNGMITNESRKEEERELLRLKALMEQTSR